MRVLFTTTLSYGHFHPLVPFARALVDAGHEVAVATGASFAPVLAHTGLRHVPAGFDGDINDMYPQLRTWWGPDRVAFMRREVFAGMRPRHMFRDRLAFAATWPPDLIVREEREYGGCLAADVHGIPHAAVGITLGGDRAFPELIAAPLEAHRVAFGLPADPNLAMPDRYLTLRPFPPGFQDPALPVARTTHYLRPLLGDRSGTEELPSWVRTLPNLPVV